MLALVGVGAGDDAAGGVVNVQRVRPEAEQGIQVELQRVSSASTVTTALASGDLDVLVERDRRALRVHLKNVDSGLAELARAVDAAFE